MNERRATKRALLTSITALVMCVVMLAGTTFAWFTDTASTNVNKIQAGKLDVALEMQKADGTWENAEGKTLEFKKADAAPSGEKVLWEPGATYELPKLRVINNGNLNIKCRVEVTGIAKTTTTTTTAGTFDLNDVIDWLATGLTLNDDFMLDTVSNKEKEFTISGTMKTTAGNDYQGLSIDGVSITVYATQAEGEFDSTRNDYDKGATYTRTNATIISETDGKTVTLEAGKTYTVGAATITTDASGNITYKNNGTAQEVTINTDGHNLTVNAPHDTVYHYGKAGTVTVTAVAGRSYHEFGEVGVLALSQGRVVVEKGDAVKILQVKANDTANPAVIAVPQNVVLDTKLETGTDVDEIVINTIDSSDRVVTVTKIESSNGSAATTKDKSPVATPKELSKIITNDTADVDKAKEYAAMIGSTGYVTLVDAVAAAKDGDTITLLRDSNGDGIVVKVNTFTNQGLTVDFNGHTYSVGGELVGSAGTGTNAFQLLKDNKITFKNGTIAGVTEGTKPAEDTPNWHGAPAIVIQNYCDLTLDNMTVTGGDETVYTMSNNNGNVTIKDTTINKGGAKGYTSGPVAFDVCNFSDYASVKVTVTGNSVINGDVELTRYKTKPDNKEVNNTLELKNCTINGNIKKSSGLVKLMGNITLNGNIDVTAAVNVREDQIRVADKTVLNLNGKINTPAGMGNYTNKADPSNSNFAAIYVEDSLTINAEGENGIYASTDNGSFAFAVMGRIWPDLTINGGTYHGYGTVAETNGQTITINGGNFSVTPFTSGGSNYLLNKVDSSNAEIIVKGGTFVNYDPSRSASENPVANFVADGYEVVSAKQSNGDTWYTVVKSTQTIT